MKQYLLSLHISPDSNCAPPKPEEMQAMFAKIEALESEMKSGGAWMFSGKLTSAADATVVRAEGEEVLTTDGPFVEAKEHIAGFYIIQAEDLDAALGWAGKVTACIGRPIEVRPFAGFKGD